MFLYNYFKNSFKITKIFEMRGEKLLKVLIFFLLLNTIIAFPMNLHAIRSRGLGIEKIGIDLKTNIPAWFPSELPNDCNIDANSGTFTCTTTESFEKEYNGMKFVLDPKDTFEANSHALVFRSNQLVYVNNNNESMSFSYTYFRSMSFDTLNDQTPEQVKDYLMSGLQNGYSTSSMVQLIVMQTGMYIIMNTIYTVILAAMALMFKFGFQNFPKFKELFIIAVFSTTIPTMLSFAFGVIGLFSDGAFAFAPLTYQFGSPIVFLLVYYKVIKPSLLN